MKILRNIFNKNVIFPENVNKLTKFNFSILAYKNLRVPTSATIRILFRESFYKSKFVVLNK